MDQTCFFILELIVQMREESQVGTKRRCESDESGNHAGQDETAQRFHTVIFSQ